MKEKLQVRLAVNIRTHNEQQERAFWSALDDFLEAFVQHQMKKMICESRSADSDAAARAIRDEQREHRRDRHGTSVTG